MLSMLRAAPTWLRVLATLGALWFIGFSALGVALIFLPGPGLLLFPLASAGAVPWLVLVLGNNGAS